MFQNDTYRIIFLKYKLVFTKNDLANWIFVFYATMLPLLVSIYFTFFRVCVNFTVDMHF